ncbi:MAG: aminotransferase class V-fold PLP-dependent enzyme [Gemmatimonadetes bacterium]|nr:aminotransferase class V-fold PLP-dependent enzyme [Gemmatimonadota bacterium]MYD24693.1 aminotransferase class V-fold PLP-dependent enzyme [Gemmatimonadota bacterium]MYI98688.1 aminotransferase class V-fold PLP-dependent enzyme [Gemmatimonadota bacterium]
MRSENNAIDLPTGRRNTMERRHFLKTAGVTAGLATFLGPDSFRGVEAAVSEIADLTPQEAARDEGLWREVKRAFTVDRSLINLDNGYACPTPRVVTEAFIRYIWEQEQNPYGVFVDMARDRMSTVKKSVARQFGSSPDEIALVRNTTEALKTVLYGIPLNRGDEVLTTTHDYPSLVRVVRDREKKEGIKLVEVPVPYPAGSLKDLVKVIEDGITSRTRVIMVSHITYTTGQVFPIRQICDLAHRHGIEVVVDGAHAVAQLDFKVSDLDCDYYGASLHKWLSAPKGTGLLYMKREHVEKIEPLYGPTMSLRFNPLTSMQKFESVGTQPLPPFLAIGEAVAFHNAIGPKRKEERLRYLKNYWAERLQSHPRIRLYTPTTPEMSCCIAGVGIEGADPTGIRDYLWNEHQIRTSRGRYDREDTGRTWVRITPNLYTTLSELDYFGDVMEEVADNGLPDPYSEYTFDPSIMRR